MSSKKFNIWPISIDSTYSPFAILSLLTTLMRLSACFSNISTYGFNEVLSQSKT